MYDIAEVGQISDPSTCPAFYSSDKKEMEQRGGPYSKPDATKEVGRRKEAKLPQ